MLNKTKYTQEEIDDALRLYSKGELGWRDLDKYGFDWFSDVIDGLARLELKLPRVDSKKLLNEKQMATYKKIFIKS